MNENVAESWRQELLRRFEEGLPFRRDLRRMVRNILRDDDATQDVLQEVHTAAWLHVHTGGTIDDLKRYLTKMARNRALDVMRQRRREVSLDSVDVEQIAEQIDVAGVDEGSLAVVLGRLSDASAERVLALVKHGTLAAAAESLGITVSALRKSLGQAMEELHGKEDPVAERDSD